MPWAKAFATGPEDPLENCHKFYCMMCKVNVSMRFRFVIETKRHCQCVGHLRQDQRFPDRYFPGVVGRKGAQV